MQPLPCAEGSAWSIAHYAIRSIFHALDGFDPRDASFYCSSALPGDERCAPPDTAQVRAAMLRYFELKEPAGMLDVMYGAGFKKDRVAGFAKEVSALGAGGDAFCAHAVARAGRELGAHLRALVQRAPPGSQPGGGAPPLFVVCVGSVWKSWGLLKEAFVRAACAGGAVGGFRLVRLKDTSAIGSAWYAGRRAGFTGLQLNSQQLVEVLYQHPH